MQRFTLRHTLVITLSIILGVLLLAGGQAQARDAVKITKANEIQNEVQNFSRVIAHIKAHYVKDVDDKELFENAIRGMLSGLDPHSNYLDEETFNDLKIATSGRFGGLGIEVTMEDGFIKVISPIDDTPAARAGIKAGDLIVRVDETPVKGMSLREAVAKMRGKAGSKLHVTVVREGEKKTLNFELTRAIITVKSIKSRIITPGYYYIRIAQFQMNTAKELRRQLTELKRKSNNVIKGVVLDLRNNPGGVLNAAVDVSDLFLDKNKLTEFDHAIVSAKGRMKRANFVERASKGDIAEGAPIIVIINAGSASASEIVAGALQDYKRGLVIGNKSFGKGSVQTVMPLSTQSGIKLTTALYYTPSGRSIQADGIEPDLTINQLNLSKNDEDTGLILKEAHLRKHILRKDKSKKDIKKKEALEWLIKDYQLFEAYHLLKGIHLLTRR